MLLGFGSKKKEKDYGDLRRTQIESFKRAFTTAKTVNSDDSAFDIAIPSASATAFLRVILPPNFPEAPPTFKLYGVAVRHPWVDVAGVVANHPRLHPWDPNNSIAEIAQQVIAEVTRHVGGSPTVGPGFSYPSLSSGLGGSTLNPNTVTGYPGQAIPYQPGSLPTYGQPGRPSTDQPPPYSGRPPPPAYGQPPQYGAATGTGAVAVAMGGASGGARPGEGKKERPPIQLPPVPSSFPEIASLPIEELNRLLTDEVAFSYLLMRLAQVKECSQMLESARKATTDMARANMAQGEELVKLKSEVVHLREVLGDMKRSYEDKLRSHQGDQPVSFKENIELLRREMSEGASAAEEKSEDLARAFTSGEVKIGDFLPEFLKTRKEFHERSAKLELVDRLGAAGPV